MMESRRKPKVRKLIVKKSIILARPKQEISPEKDSTPWILGIIIILFVGSVLYSSIGNQASITGKVIADNPPQKFIQGNTIWEKSCLLGELPIKDDASETLACNTKDDCINLVNEYNKVKGRPQIPPEVLEIIKCVDVGTEVTE